MSLSIRKTKRETPIRIKMRWNSLLEINRVNKATYQGKKDKVEVKTKKKAKVKAENEKQNKTLPF
jgi:hypothetical protein